MKIGSGGGGCKKESANLLKKWKHKNSFPRTKEDDGNLDEDDDDAVPGKMKHGEEAK